MAEEIPHDALIVICDGGKAILLRNTGTETRLVLQEERRLTFEDVENDGPSGKRPSDQTRQQTDEATFAKQLVKQLTAMHENQHFSALVLAAAPQTLGEMRDAMHKNLQQSIIFTLSKDLTNMSLPEVTRILEEAGAAPTTSD